MGIWYCTTDIISYDARDSVSITSEITDCSPHDSESVELDSHCGKSQ